MRRPTDRRTILTAAGIAAVAAAARPAAAQAAEITGAVTFAGGAAIPAGRLEIYLEAPGDGRAAATRIESDGKARELAFALAPPADAGAVRVVARLERADGWLLARGSASVEAGAPVALTLDAVMY